MPRRAGGSQFVFRDTVTSSNGAATPPVKSGISRHIKTDESDDPNPCATRLIAKSRPMIIDTHVHVFTGDRKRYPQVRDTPRAGKVPSVTDIGQAEWPVTTGETLVTLMNEAGIDK